MQVTHRHQIIGTMEDLTLNIKNKLEETEQLPDFLQKIGKELSLSVELINSLNLAIEEALVNSVQYAYPPSVDGSICLASHWDEPKGMLQFTLSDQGKPFDPTASPEADTTLSVEDRPIGGLGIFLIRQIMDEVEYQYKDNSNIFVMRKIIHKT